MQIHELAQRVGVGLRDGVKWDNLEQNLKAA